MTETISGETRYGFDDLTVGDRVKIDRKHWNGEQQSTEGVVVESGYSKTPKIRTVFADFYADRTTDSFTLIGRPDPVADVVSAWRTTFIKADPKVEIRATWPRLADALDALERSRA